MRIILSIPYNPLEEVGGLELSTIRHAKALQQRGHSVSVVSKGPSGKCQGVKIIGLPNFGEIAKYLIKHVNEFDLVHWLEIFPDKGEVELQGMVSGVLQALGKSTVLMVATSGNLRVRGTGTLTTPILKGTMDAYIISNPEQINEFAESGITENIYSFGFGIDTKVQFRPVSKERKTQIRKQLGLSVDKTLCLFMGRFVQRKRPDFLLRAWLTLTDIYNQAELVVVGSGMGQDDSIESSVLELVSSSQNVVFRDITSKPDLYYKACDVLLLPSSREGQPNVLLEAMACGMPVIGSSIPGIQEMLINNQTGLSFTPDDQQEFSRDIRQIIHTPELGRYLSF